MRAIRDTSWAFTRVYARFDPGGVSMSIANSDVSISGTNPAPTSPSAGNASAPTNVATARNTIAKR